MDCLLTKHDSDLCLQNSEQWSGYKCADSKKWCNSWKKDMHRCCPHTCKVSKETPFTKAVCDSVNGGKGKCDYPFKALDNDCKNGNEEQIFKIGIFFFLNNLFVTKHNN